MVVVVGPHAADRRSAVEVLAGITGATVVNTVGAKGLFPWDSPLHGGTVGLQVGDAGLAEITSADLVITSGLDDAESLSLTTALTARAATDPDAVVDVVPEQLAMVAGGWPPATAPGTRPRLYEALAGVVGPLYGAPGAPPARARALAEALPEGGLVVAPPGPAGFWVGRTFPTSVLGSVAIPVGRGPGAARDRAAEAASFKRPVTLILSERDLDGPDGEPAPTGVEVEVWSDLEGRALDSLIEVAGAPDESIWPD